MKKFGLTLLELVLAIVISGILLSLALGTFSLLFRAQQKMEEVSFLQREISFALMKFADVIRNEEISFSAFDTSSDSVCAGQNSFQSSALCFSSGNFEFCDDQLFFRDQPLFSSRFRVISAQFFVFPAVEHSSFVTPSVSLSFLVQSRIFPDVQFPLQTTFSSRQYP